MPAVPLALLSTIIVPEDGKSYEIMTMAQKEDGDKKEGTLVDSSQQVLAEGGLSDSEPPGYKEIDQSQEKETYGKASPNRTVASPLHISDQSFCINIIETSDISDFVTF